MPTRRTPIHAAGAVVLRDRKGRREVLVVHRPRYKDWTLPKGKMEPDEYLPVTAVREVYEETGYQVALISKIDTLHYKVGKRPKIVEWWLAEPRAHHKRKPDREVDKVSWWPVERAMARLTFDTDVYLLAQALATKPTTPLLVVRHTKAMPRKSWKGDDRDRRLTERGRRQAKALVGLLEAFNVSALASSTSNRCMQTFAPYAASRKLEITGYHQLSEESFADKPKGASRKMAAIVDMAAHTATPSAVCGHRPVLPTMLDVVGYDPGRTLKPGEVLVLNLNDKRQLVTVTAIPPRL